jgi:isopenicillin-N epimerase
VRPDRAECVTLAAVPDLRDLFLLDPDVVFLNHGSFGACPRPVFEEYQRFQRELERQPVEFLGRRVPGLLDEAAVELGTFLNADAEGLVFVPNATSAVNVVARSLRLLPNDEVLATDHEYGALDLLWEFVCGRTGARYVRRAVPVPLESENAALDAIWPGVTERTRVLFLSHVSSKTAVRFPVAELCRRAREAGITTIVDGAHAPGQVPVDLAEISADFYAGNCHKWLCAPKGSGFLWTAPEHRGELEPLVVRWGWGADSTFRERHGWQGTRDPAAHLAIPAAIRFQREHGWDDVRRRCHGLLAAVLQQLGPPVAAESLYAQMASVELPPCDADTVRSRLLEEHQIEVACERWNDRPLLRVSVQSYNEKADLERLVHALPLVMS